MATQVELFDAIQSGNLERLKALLAEDPQLAGARDPAGLSAVLHARYRSRLDMVEALLAQNPPLDIFEAAAMGNKPRVAELLSRQPELARAYSPDGFTPLHLASFFGHPEVAELLLKYHAEVNAVSRNTMSVKPLHSAAATRQRRIVELLLENGAEVNAAQHGGWTALHAAADNGDSATAELLLSYGANPAAKSDDGRTPVDMAAAKGHAEFARRLRSA